MTEHLIDHGYTVLEIERMRRAVYDIMFPIVWYTLHSGSQPGAGGRVGEAEAKVEVQLRTYMLNGTRPEELEALAKERADQSERQRLSLVERSS